MPQGLQHKIRAWLVEDFITEGPEDVTEINVLCNPLEKYRGWVNVNVFPSKLALSNHSCHTHSTSLSTNWLPLQIKKRPISDDYSERKSQRVVECELKKAEDKIRAGNHFSSKNTAKIWDSALKEMNQTLDLDFICAKSVLRVRILTQKDRLESLKLNIQVQNVLAVTGRESPRQFFLTL